MTTKVLAIDDSRTIRNLLRVSLEGAGFEYHSACDGVEGVEQFSEVEPDVVITDINMPNMDGLGLLQAVRQNKATQRMGVILVTGKPTPDIVATAKKWGLNNMIKKPFTSLAMKQCIESVVGKL